MTEVKQVEGRPKDPRGRKPIPASERKVFIRFGVKRKDEAEAMRLVKKIERFYSDNDKMPTIITANL